MTKKHYIKFANVLKRMKNVPVLFQEAGVINSTKNVILVKKAIIEYLMPIFANDNYNFDGLRFETYVFDDDKWYV